MNRTETLQVMAVLKAAYPNFYRDMTRQEAEGVVALWESLFDEPVEIVAAAVKALIVTDRKGFPPHIGAVKEKIQQLTQPELMTEQEAWTLVSNALCNSTYNSQQEFDRLPPIVQRLVGSPKQLREWAMLDTSQVQTVVASNFMRSYRARSTSERDYLALPDEIKALASSIGDRLALESGSTAGSTKEGNE